MSSIQKTPKPNTPTSSKPTVMVLEGLDGDIHKDPHAHDVARSAQRALPEDNPVGISFRGLKKSKDKLSINSIQIFIESAFISGFDQFTSNLKDISKLDKSKRPNAVNASISKNELTVFTQLKDKPKLFFDIGTQTEQTNLFDLKKKESHGYVWKLPELESYIDKTVANSTNIAKATEKAEDAVEALKQKNVAVIVASGNYNDDIEALKKEHPDVQFESDEGQSIFAVKNTITVGASNADGTLTDYSSRGGEVDFTTQVPPSIEGRSIIKQDEYGTYEGGKTRGTSFTAPAVAGMYSILIAQGYSVDEATAYLKRLGKAKKDDTPEANPYTDLNLEDVQKKLAQFNKPASKEKK